MYRATDAHGRNSGCFIANVADSRKFHRFQLWRVVPSETIISKNRQSRDKMAGQFESYIGTKILHNIDTYIYLPYIPTLS